MKLVRIVKDWDWPNILRQTPGQNGVWNDFQFTLDPIEECDFLLMFNNRMKEEIRVSCPAGNVWMIIQEPYVPGVTDWVQEKHDHFDQVFTHSPVQGNEKYIKAHPAIPWHVNKTFDQLVDIREPKKNKRLSWVVGNANEIPGHMLRWSFLKHIQKSDLEIDLFGRAISYIEDKWEGLAPYYFSLAIENNSGPDMWTEKLADCFLSWTVPIYFGCTNLEEYFPKESFIRIDITKPEQSLEIIKRSATSEGWRSRLSALKEARDLVLFKYQLFPFIVSEAQKRSAMCDKKIDYCIPPYKKSGKAQLLRLQYKLKRLLKRF